MINVFLQLLVVEIQLIWLVDVIDMEYVEDCFICEWFSFDCVQQGEVIGYWYDGQVVLVLGDGYIVFFNLCVLLGNEWFYFGVDSQCWL